MEFVKASKLILNSTFFTFNNKFYRQTFGILIGSQKLIGATGFGTFLVNLPTTLFIL